MVSRALWKLNHRNHLKFSWRVSKSLILYPEASMLIMDSLSKWISSQKLEQLERLRSEDTPATSRLPIPSSHIGSQVKSRQSQSYKFKKFANSHYTRHTFWSCLIRCANMKWIRWVLLKIQSGHDSVHRRTDGQGDTSIPPFQLRWSGEYNYLICYIHAQFLTVVSCSLSLGTGYGNQKFYIS